MYNKKRPVQATMQVLLSILLVVAQAFSFPAAMAEDAPVLAPVVTDILGDADAQPVAPDDTAPVLVPEATAPDLPDTSAADSATQPPDAPVLIGGGWTRPDAQPMNVRDILSLMGISPTSIVDGFSLGFYDQDMPVDMPTESAQIEMSFSFYLPSGVPAQMREDDWYTITLPDTLYIPEYQVFSLKADTFEFATVEAEAGTLQIKFLSAVQAYGDMTANFTVWAAFAPGAYAPAETVVLSLDDEHAPEVSFTMQVAEDSILQNVEEILGIDSEETDPLLTAEGDEILEIASEILDTQETLSDADETPTDEIPTMDSDEPVLIQEEDADDMPVLVADAAASLQGQGLVTGFSLAYTRNGEPLDAPTLTADVAVTMTVQPSDELKAALSNGTGYTVTLPDALAVSAAQAVDIAGADGSFGVATVNTDGTVALTFSPALETMDAPEGTFTFNAAFNPQVVSTPGAYTLSLPDEANAPAVTVDLADADTTTSEEPTTPEDPWTRTDDTPMDVKKIFDALGLPSDSILTGIQLTYQEPGGGETSSTEASVDASIDFGMTFHIPKEVTANMREGDTYVIDLPSEIDVVQGDTYELYNDSNPGSPSYATVVVGEDGRITITFHDPIKTLGDTDGTFHFSASFDKDKINTPGDHVIQIPNEPEDINSHVTIKSQVDQSVDKKGSTDKPYNPDAVTWDVDFNKPLQTLNNAVLSDPMPDGLTLASTEVYTIQVDLAGNVIAGSEAPMDPSLYTVDPDGTVHFTQPISSAVRVRYQADVTANTDAGGDMTFVNNATLTADDHDPLTASATVTAHYGKFLDKRNAVYDPVNQEFTWEIRYNYGQQDISQSDAVLTDTLNGPGMVYEPGTVIVRAVTIDANGKPTLGAPLDPSEYTVTYNGNQMEIAMNHDVNQALNITYKTHIEGIVDDSGVQYSNDVSTKWGEHEHGTGATKPSQQQNIVKSMYDVNETLRRITWVVQINRSGYMMHDWSMTDTLGQGLHLVNENMLAIRDVTADPNITLQVGRDYEISARTEDSFTVSFLGDYKEGTNHAFEMVYYTEYDVDAPQTVSNKVTGNWYDDSDNPHSSSSNVTYPRTPVDVNNGQKYGTYNAVTKEITWYILTNYHQLAYRPATLTDTIKGDQQYIHDSLRIYQAVGDTNQIGTEIPPSAIGATVSEPTDTNNETLTVSFPGASEEQTMTLWIVFRTSLVGQMIDTSDTYANDAVFNANGVDYPLHGSVDVHHGGELASKTGTQESDGYVHWSATINASQSTMESVVLTDTPSDNQRIDMDSLAFYRTAVSPDGTITPNYSQRLTAGTDYTAAYAQNDAGTWVLTVHFLGTMDTAYVMQYRASVYMTGMTGTVDNNLHLEGMNNTVVHDDDNNAELPVRVHEGGGTIYGTGGSVTIRKLGADNQPLPGAVLVLVDEGGNRTGPITVGESGEILFSGIVQGTYTLYELSAPAGYTVSPSLASGMKVVVDNDTTNGDRIVTVQNELTEVSLRKVSQTGDALAGAVFHLEQKNAESGDYEPYGNGTTYISGEDGYIHIYSLTAGTYRFVEEQTAGGHFLNIEPVEFTLSADDKGVMGPLALGDYVNHLASISLMKTAEDGTPLAGAVFTLSRYEGDEIGEEVGSYRTDANGNLTIPNLPVGDYLLVETYAPAGYVTSGDPRRITISDLGDGVVPALNIGPVTNRAAKGLVLLRKTDGATGAALAGAVFDLIRLDLNETVGQVTIGADGTASINQIAPGDYHLVEVTAPAGYILNTTPWAFNVPENADGSLTPIDIGNFDNYKGNVRLTKVDESGDPLMGAGFELTRADGSVIDTFETNAQGIIEINALAPGVYYLRETYAPDEYALITDPIEITIPAEAEGELPTLEIGPIVDPPARGAILIEKTDPDTAAQLAGAVFQVVNRETGEVVATATTGTDGIATVDDLLPGDYTLREITAPEGYVRNTTTIDFTIPPNGTVAAIDLGNFENQQGKLKLEKVNEDGNPIAGVGFELTQADGTVVGSYETDEAGIIEIDGLAPGTYHLRETHAPGEYALITDPIDITIPSEAEGTLPTLEIGPIVDPPARGAILLEKVDPDTGTRLAGAVFQVTDRETGEEIARVTTGEDGVVRVDDLVPGDYTLAEVTAPEGYIRNTRTVDFTIPPNGTVAAIDLGTFENFKGYVRLEKVDENGAPLMGAGFELTQADGTVVGIYETDEAGIIEIDGLAPGTYRLHETYAPEGYGLITDPIDITIPVEAEGELPTLEIGPIVDPPARGAILFEKIDPDTAAQLAGAVFQVVDRKTGEVVANVTTGEDGAAEIDDLLPGDYMLREITAPEGYVRNTAIIDFTIPPNGTVAAIDLGTFENQQGKIKLEKVNEDGAPIAGVGFELTQANGTVVGSYETDEAGIIEIDGLAPGTYHLRETHAPGEYALITDPINITIPSEAEGTLSTLEIGPIVDPPARGAILLEKVDPDTGTRLAGAIFQVIDRETGEEIARVTTGEDGIATVDDLVPGDYTLAEVTAPEGYIRNTHTVDFTIPPNGTVAQIDLGTFENFKGHVRLEKVDEHGAPLMGAGFELTQADGTVVGTYETDEAGVIEIDDLAPGRYQLHETYAPEGYGLITDPIDITIPAETEGALPTLAIGPVVDPPARGAILFRKVDHDTATRLTGAIFQVVSRETGEEIARVTTGSDGTAAVDDLLPGDYTLREVTAPRGYILNTRSIDFTIPPNGTVAAIDLGIFENQQGRIQLTKIGEDGTPLAGATFTLTTSDGEVLGTYKTDADGSLEIYMLAPGTYQLTESSAPVGFDLTGNPMTFTIPASVNSELRTLQVGPVINKRQVGVAVIHKVDAATSLPLAGVVFSLIRADTGAEVARVTTDASGMAAVSNLQPGSYRFIEISAPYGYVVDSTPIPVEITAENHATPVEVVAVNQRIPNPSPTPTIRPTVPPGGPPQTGDFGGMALGTVMAISGLGIAGSLLYLLRNRKKH